MKRLGISVYLNNNDLEKNLEYINLASRYGFEIVFTTLISIKDLNFDKYFDNFVYLVKHANNIGMKVIVDVEPHILSKLNISYDNLYKLSDIGLYGIRLDLGYSGIEESIMSFNDFGLKIVVNMSNGSKYIENILSYKPNIDNIIGCHNFYPHKYTGLSYEHFSKCSRQFKDLGIRTAAFISSSEAMFGPWPVSEGLCTLEMHRDLPIETQAKHLFATELIDDVIIANAYASEDELKKLSLLNKYKLEFKVNLVDNITDIDKKIVLEEFHYVRGDVSEYLLRSTQSRIKYKDYKFLPYNVIDIKRGDILIDTYLYQNYAGELQIALKDMKNTGKTNVVGRIDEKEIFLLDYLKPWTKFGFVENK
ncbi:DUF871 domain-containing protein [Thermoanaerobacterium thermosaccharolyticum]|uniref:DUF871 domain-containing protein n=1 Tax=Thermoanaerobacterium thermosaccharolyticum TaxID=1517 RepID=UPI003DAA01D1